MRAGCLEAVIGRGYKGAVAADAAYVRSTMDDGRLESSRALRGNLAIVISAPSGAIVSAQRAQTSQVDSPAPPCPGCFGVASRLLTPTGQKLCFWLNCLVAAGSFHPYGAKADAFGQTGLQPSPVFTLRAAHPRCPYALAAVVRVVHRTSKIVHGRCQAPPSYIVHRT